MKKIILFCWFCFSFFYLTAQNSIDNFFNNTSLQYANVSVLVKDLNTSENICEHRSHYSIIPASTMKLVTTATALELLGPNFQFETKLQIEGKIDEKGLLNGNLYIVGGGDPTLGSEFLGNTNFLNYWVNAIKKVGINKINGSIIADESLFDNEGINARWIWEDIGNYYAAPTYAISYKDNMVRIQFKTGEVGSTPKIQKTTPYIADLTFENNLKCSVWGRDSAYFYGAPRSNHRVIYGEIPANRNTFTSKMDLPNPGLLLATHLHEKLVERGVEITQLPTYQLKKGGNRKTIYTHVSPTLDKIIKVINFKSNNHYAEHVFRYLALQKKDVASTSGAMQVIRTFWNSKKLPIQELFMYDGSGLSPSNAVSANFFVGLLTYMKNQSTYSTVFYNSLPTAGETGTIAWILKNTPLQGKLHAKSGSINRVRCYAGYIDISGKSYAFAVMTNNYTGNPRQVVRKIEQFLLECVK